MVWMSKETGKRIKNRREELGLRAEDVAEKAGMKKATYYRYEKGDIENMNFSKLKAIAAVLQASPVDFVVWDEEMPTTKIGSGHDELNNLINQLSDEDLDDVLEFVRYKLSKNNIFLSRSSQFTNEIDQQLNLLLS